MQGQKRKLTPLVEEKGKNGLLFCTSYVIIERFNCCCAYFVQEFHASPYLLPLKVYGTELFMIWHQFGIKRPCFMLGFNWYFFSKVAVA